MESDNVGLDDVALFDMDGSLADYTASLAAALDSLRSSDEPPVTEENIWTLEKQRHIQNRMHLIKSQPGFWLNLAPIQDGMDVLKACRQWGFHIAILTKGPQKHSAAWAEKLQWCQRYIDEDVDVTVTFKKGRVYGKVLYDDYPEYMLDWLKHRPRGLGIMPVTPNNKDFDHPNVIMYHGLEDMQRVMTALRVAKYRKSGVDVIYQEAL